LSDTIYGKAFTEKSLHNFLNDIGYEYSAKGFYINIHIEGCDASKLPFWESKLEVNLYEDHKPKTIFDVAISPSLEHLEVRDNCGFFTRNGYQPISSVKTFSLYNLYYLPVGTYRITLDLYLEVPQDEHDRGIHTRLWRTKFGERIDIAKGGFTLRVDEAGREALGKRLAIKRQLRHSMPEVEADIMRLITSQKIVDRFESRVLALDTSSDWSYERDKIWNHVISRSVGCDVFVEYDNGARAIYYTTFKQEHLGNGNFSPTKWASTRFHDLYTKESIIEYTD